MIWPPREMLCLAAALERRKKTMTWLSENKSAPPNEFGLPLKKLQHKGPSDTLYYVMECDMVHKRVTRWAPKPGSIPPEWPVFDRGGR